MREILRAALDEVTRNPAHFIAEVVQSLLLIGIIWWFGRPALAKRLNERSTRIGNELDAADAATRDAVRLREESTAVVNAAREQAAAMAQTAADQIATLRATSTSDIEREAERLVEQAQQTIAHEREQARQRAADRLVQLTTEAARIYLDDVLTEVDRRALTRTAILKFLDTADAHANDAPAGAA